MARSGKRRGCLIPLLIILVVAAVVIGGWYILAGRVRGRLVVDVNR